VPLIDYEQKHPKIQQFDIFFKKIFSQSINSFLDILNSILPINIGNSVSSVLPEVVSKGILRADLIINTNKDFILIFEFKDEIGIEAYSAINAYVATHAHTTKAYNTLLPEKKAKLPYVPIIVGFSLKTKYRDHLKKFKLIRNTDAEGIYLIAASPYYKIYTFVLNEMNLSNLIASVIKKHPKLKIYSNAIRDLDTINFWSLAIQDTYYRDAAIAILQYFGELILLTKHDASYFKSIYDFANLYAPERAKDILNLTIIIFLRRKVDGIMSLSKILTLEEKKKVIEAFGVDAAIKAFGIEKVIEAVGVEYIIDTLKKLVDEGKINKKYLKKLLE